VKGRLGREYFEDLYTESGDPWDFETSEYECNKYRRTLEVLGERRFERALEAGASIGVFTEMLAGRCDELLAVDVSERAVVAARERLSDRGHVAVERRTLPEEMPDGPFDLIVASEILYYFTREEMLATLRAFEQEVARGESCSQSTGAERPEPTRCRVTRCTSYSWDTRDSTTARPSSNRITAWISSRTQREP
jgi:cyclopropane fatty-acyl-phospholipid synthase-like methyltransferase